MSTFARWLSVLHPAHGPRVAAALAELPGRAVYPGRAPAQRWDDEAFGAAEFSVRESAPSLRLSYSIDPERAGTGALAATLRRLGADPAPVAHLTGHALVGIEQGEGSPRIKAYVYADRGHAASFAPVVRGLAAAIGGSDWLLTTAPLGAPSFAAVDLFTDAPAALKLYFECATRAEAAEKLDLAGAPALRAIVDALPDPPAGLRAPFVVTVRGGHAGALDVTLHAKPGRARVDPLIGSDLAARRAELSASAEDLGFTWRTSYVSWLVSPRGRARTLYGQLWPRSAG